MAQTIAVNSRGRISQKRIEKAENDAITVNVDFGLFFDTDTASTATVTADSGLTVGTPTVSTNVVTFLVSGGDDGYSYDVTVKLAGTTETKEIIFQVAVANYDYPADNDYWVNWWS